MPVTKTVTLQPENEGQFLAVQQAVIKAVQVYAIHKMKAFINSKEELFNPAQLKILSREQEGLEKYGSWVSVGAHTSDFKNFNIVFGNGDKNKRSVFLCEHLESESDIPAISFISNDWGTIDEFLDVIGHACAPFGKTVKINNNDDVIFEYEVPETV